MAKRLEKSTKKRLPTITWHIHIEYIDIPRTSVEIYKNLTANGFEIPEEKIDKNIEDEKGNKLGIGVRIISEKIDLTVKGKYGKYGGEIAPTGITQKIVKIDTDNNQQTLDGTKYYVGDIDVDYPSQSYVKEVIKIIFDTKTNTAKLQSFSTSGDSYTGGQYIPVKMEKNNDEYNICFESEVIGRISKDGKTLYLDTTFGAPSRCVGTLTLTQDYNFED